MNFLDYNQDGGFRVSTEILAAAQTAYTLFNQLGWLGGDLTIISGCTVAGTSVSDGYVFINGEVLPFKGGIIGTNVVVKQNDISYPFQNGTVKPVVYERFATFGTAHVVYPWSSFSRVFQTKDIQNFKNDFESRISALENKPSEWPVGAVIRFDQPLVVLPPTGWEDWNPVDEQGRVWAARSISDSDFGLGVKGGEKAHQLSIYELPPHSHTMQFGIENVDSGGIHNVLSTNASSSQTSITTTPSGGSGGSAQPHNNLQPYVAVRYIKRIS